MTKAQMTTPLALTFSLCAAALAAQDSAKAELAAELVKAKPFQIWIDRVVFVSKQRALLPYTGTDLDPEQMEVVRSIFVQEWTNARSEIEAVYAEALSTTYSENTLQKLIDFYADVELQNALAMRASAETFAFEGFSEISPLVDARIKTRMTTELDD